VKGGFQAERRGRTLIATIELGDFAAGSVVLSTQTRGDIAAATNSHLKQRYATARVTGWRTGAESTAISRERADAVCTHIVDAVLDDDRGKGAGANIGSVQAWSHDGGVRDTPGVTILIEAPAGGV
jgi:hypothetical protein